MIIGASERAPSPRTGGARGFILHMTLALLVGLYAFPADAGEGAGLLFLGFSPDGRAAAFEQYGVDNETRFPYAQITIVDVAANKWLPDMPLLSVVTRAGAALRQAREEAAAQAAPLMKRLGVARRGELLAADAEGEIHAPLDGAGVEAARAQTQSVLALQGETFGSARLALETIAVEAPACAGGAKGIALTLERVAASPLLLQRDASLRKSRFCPQAYGLAEARAFRAPDGDTAFVAFIETFPPGVRGPDRRFIAVTTLLKKDAP